MSHHSIRSERNPVRGPRSVAAVLAAAALAAAIAPAAWPQESSGVVVDDFGTVDIAVQDTDLAQVLQMLALESRRNIITSKRVSARVTANLFDVNFKEALDAILKVNGYGYIEQGNFIYVHTLDEIAEIERSRKTRESRRFQLEHIAPQDAMEFVQPLVSERGRLSVAGEVERGFQPGTSTGGEDSWAYGAMLVVNDFPENLQAIANLLAEIDTPPKQVVVEATVVETKVNEDNAFGVDFSVLLGGPMFSDFASPLAVVNQLINPGILGPSTPDQAEAVVSTVGGTAGPGGLKVGVVQGDVSVFLRVLDQVTDTTVLARPRVMALNRQRAQVLVGRRLPYLSSTQTETSTTQTVNFLDTGIRLIFRPFISSDGSIRLELAPSVSSATLINSTAGSDSGQRVPEENVSEITTNVRLQDGQTLVLGGLFTEDTTITRRQVPWLGDIPVVGAAFSGQDDTIVRREIIFLITPTIMNDRLADTWAREAEEFVDAVKVGARAGLLPFSRELVSGNHNQEAFEAFEAGDPERAMFHINASLRVNPNQPEIIRLRSEIQRADGAVQPSRSLLERILDREHAPVPPAERAETPTRDPLLGSVPAGSGARAGADPGTAP